MGTTLRPGNLSRGEVRREINNYKNTSLYDHMLFNNKSVGDYKKNRQYQRDRYAQKKQSPESPEEKPLLDTNLTRSKDADMMKRSENFVDNNGNTSYARIKQAALLKLATIRLAINYILRTRQQFHN